VVELEISAFGLDLLLFVLWADVGDVSVFE
jgi:hypothetical protein